MTNLDNLVSESNLSHIDISSRAGRKGNWFNDAYNNNEDIRLSSLAKILSIINKEKDITEYVLSDLFDKKVLEIARVLSNINDEDENSVHVLDFISAEDVLFVDLLGDWGSLESKRKLNSEEKMSFHKIKEFIKQQQGGQTDA